MKLYKAEIKFDVFFTAEGLIDNADVHKYAISELDSMLTSNLNMEIKEVVKEEDIPKIWKNCIPWGENNFCQTGTTCLEFIKENDKNYQIQLKKEEIKVLEKEIKRLKNEK